MDSNLQLEAQINELIEQWRRRQLWHRSEKSLTLQAKAMCRRLVGGDKKEAEALYNDAVGKREGPLAEIAFAAIAPLVVAKAGIEAQRKVVEKELTNLAKTLPAVEWVKATKGLGLLTFAGVIAEAGDLSKYSNPAKLWKRMGLAVIGGERQRKKTNVEEAALHGYNPSRRSLVWTIGDCIIKAGGPLKELYDERKVLELTRVATKMHAHNRAKRYIEKRLLRDLWRAWREAIIRTLPTAGLPLSEPFSAAGQRSHEGQFSTACSRSLSSPSGDEVGQLYDVTQAKVADLDLSSERR